MAASPRYISESVYPDGGYVALVEHYGRQYAVHYIGREIRLYGQASSSYQRSWQRHASAKAVKAAVAARIAELGSEWAAAHDKLYAKEAQA